MASTVSAEQDDDDADVPRLPGHGEGTPAFSCQHEGDTELSPRCTSRLGRARVNYYSPLLVNWYRSPINKTTLCGSVNAKNKLRDKVSEETSSTEPSLGSKDEADLLLLRQEYQESLKLKQRFIMDLLKRAQEVIAATDGSHNVVIPCQPSNVPTYSFGGSEWLDQIEGTIPEEAHQLLELCVKIRTEVANISKELDEIEAEIAQRENDQPSTKSPAFR